MRMPLRDIADFINGYCFKETDWNNDGLPIIRIQNLTDESKPFNRTTLKTHTKYIVERGDILVSWSATLGVFEWNKDKALLNQHIFKVIPNKQLIDKRYLFYSLNNALSEMNKHLHGATMRHINRNEFINTKINVPSLDEQQRIAKRLDLTSKMRSLAAIRKAKLNKLEASLFFKLFGDPLTNTKRWNQKKLKEIAFLKTGNTPSRVNKNYFGDHIEWIKSDNLNNEGDYPSPAKEMLSKEGMKVGRIAKKDSILVTCIAGSPSCIGNSCILDRAVAFNQQINSIEVIAEEPFFIYSQIKLYKNLIQNASNNSMKGMVNKSKFGEIKLIIPPINIQRIFSKQAQINKKIISRIDSMQNKVDEFNKSLQFKLINNI